MVRNILIVFIILTALGFFNFAFIDPEMIKVFELLGISVTVLIIFMRLFYNREVNFKARFKGEILIIFIGITLSMFMADWGHGQVLSTTAIAQRFMYFYLFYWALHSLKPTTDDIHKLILSISAIYYSFYILQYFAYPTLLFNVRISEERETLRIFLPGFTFLVLGYFMILNRLFMTFTLPRFLLLLMLFSTFIMLGTRQILFSILILTIANILFSQKVKSKVFIFVLLILSMIPIFLMFQEIFTNLIDLSKQQTESIAENVRIRAVYFFLTELFPNTLAYITGNGADSSNSTYGFMIQMYKDAYGFFQSDIGLIGDYTKFGIFFIIGVTLIMIRVLKSNIGDEYKYIKYFYLSVLLTLFTGGGPFAQSDSIVGLCITLYLLDVHFHDKEIEELSEKEDELELINETGENNNDHIYYT